MTTALILDRPPAVRGRWRLARGAALLAVPLLLLALVLFPAPALRVLWYGIIPILPAVFFVNPGFWRGVCPLATLNAAGNRVGDPRPVSPAVLTGLGVGGLLLFHLMVPARHLWFNQHGLALAITIVVVGGLAMVMGMWLPIRSGFCNALCPVHPVELLYGQSPLVELTRGRCDTCTLCTSRGCIDLVGRKAVPQVLGSSRHSMRWLLTPHGVFFAALPGFIIGYNRVADGSWSTVLPVYAATLGWSLLSYLGFVLVTAVLQAGSRAMLLGAAALSGVLYYWFTGPAIARQFGLGSWAGWVIQLGALGLIGVWLVRAEMLTGRNLARK